MAAHISLNGCSRTLVRVAAGSIGLRKIDHCWSDTHATGSPSNLIRRNELTWPSFKDPFAVLAYGSGSNLCRLERETPPRVCASMARTPLFYLY
jgi:hypothetical protein